MTEWPAYTRDLLAVVRAAEVDGLLPQPLTEALGDIFPFEHDVRMVPVDEPVLPEPPRSGEGGQDCSDCTAPDATFAWTSQRWRLRSLSAKGDLGVHVFMLSPREHVDLSDVGPELAAELGLMLIAVERAMLAGIDGVGRVHINRWGDGAEHLHWWFIARPAGLLQLRGSHLPTWLDILPPLPPTAVAEAVAGVVAHLNA